MMAVTSREGEGGRKRERGRGRERERGRKRERRRERERGREREGGRGERRNGLAYWKRSIAVFNDKAFDHMKALI